MNHQYLSKTHIIMKVLAYFLLIFCFTLQMEAQNSSSYRVVRSNLGSSGSSHTVETSKGRYYISQSVGQSSVIGTHYNNGYYLRQGYQQPTTNIKAVRDLDIELQAKVFPNPFSRLLFISFSETLRNDISVKLFDVNARTIYSNKFSPAQKLELQLHDINSGTYFLKVASGTKQFNTKLIKN